MRSAGARLVLPGFVDTHRHGWQSGGHTERPDPAGRVVKQDGQLLHPAVTEVVAAAGRVARRLAGI